MCSIPFCIVVINKPIELALLFSTTTTTSSSSSSMTTTTKERQAIEVAKLEAELNALKVDAKKVRTSSLRALSNNLRFRISRDLTGERERERSCVVVVVFVGFGSSSSSSSSSAFCFCVCVLSFSLSTVVVYEKSFTLRAFGGVFVATLYFETNTNASLSLSLSLSLSKTMNE